MSDDTPLLPAEAPVKQRLFAEPFAFDFFQAVRLLERMAPDRATVGRSAPARREVVRFRAHLSLAFPPSSIHDLEKRDDLEMPLMTVAFLGLYGPSGILPRHYTEHLLRLARDGKGEQKHAFRAWLDLFNHRFTSLFYRAWEKYRFHVPFERGEFHGKEPDPFTQMIFSFVGLGLPCLRGRLKVAVPEVIGGERRERVLAQIDDLALLHYAGFFAHRPRNAVSLELLLRNFFGLNAEVQQFRGQWLPLARSDQTQLGAMAQLGVNAVAGDRVWDVISKFRIRVGPLSLEEFNEFLPDPIRSPRRKAFFLLSHLVRLYVGPELDFDVQLILRSRDVPPCRLDGGAFLGWNTWILSGPPERDVDQAAFEAQEVVYL